MTITAEQRAAGCGTAEEAIAFALLLDDHFDRLFFLRAWRDGSVAGDEDWQDYHDWRLEQTVRALEPQAH